MATTNASPFSWIRPMPSCNDDICMDIIRMQEFNRGARPIFDQSVKKAKPALSNTFWVKKEQFDDCTLEELSESMNNASQKPYDEALQRKRHEYAKRQNQKLMKADNRKRPYNKQGLKKEPKQYANGFDFSLK